MRLLTRAIAVVVCVTVTVAPVRAQAAADRALQQVDHIIYATTNLDSTVEDLTRRLGVRAAPAGESPGRGTRSALLSLGDGAYLEIVSPDSKGPQPLRLPWYLRDLISPRVVLWAAKGRSLDSLRAMANAQAVPLGEVMSSSRVRPDGVVLTWHFTSPRVPVAGGVVPFFIDWGDAPHPSRTSPAGVRLIALSAAHPDVDGVHQMFRSLGLSVPVARSDRPGLIAVLVGPSGRVELR